MKILYGARYARFDLLYATNHLACHVSKWDEDCDKALHRLVSYIDTTYHYRQVGYVGDDQADIGSRYWSDASFVVVDSVQVAPFKHGADEHSFASTSQL